MSPFLDGFLLVGFHVLTSSTYVVHEYDSVLCRLTITKLHINTIWCILGMDDSNTKATSTLALTLFIT